MMMKRIAGVAALVVLCATAAWASNATGEEGFGVWPQADLIDCQWFPSRSTHYGFQPTGACGFGNAVNCWPGGGGAGMGCAGIPKDAINPIFGGLYAAPDGNYFAQTGDYLSCGECFQIQCDDPECVKDKIITVQIADSCPCHDNPKWCCGKESQCQEMNVLPSLEGQGHCAVLGGAWDTRSIHLDLSNYAFALLATGDREGNFAPGVLNTKFRRVSCPVTGNIFVKLQPGVQYQSCVVGSTGSTVPCFYYAEFATINAAGRGGIAQVQFVGSMIIDGKQQTGVFPLVRDPNYATDQPQTRFGGWTHKAGQALMIPFKLRFIDRLGVVADSKDFTTDNLPEACNENFGCYIDSGAQFPAPALPADPTRDCVPQTPTPASTAPPPNPPAQSSTAAPAPASSTGPAPPPETCFASASDVGSNGYYLSFNIVATGGKTIATVQATNAKQSVTMKGPFAWSQGNSVFTASPPTVLGSPLTLVVTYADGAINHLPVPAFGGNYTCA